MSTAPCCQNSSRSSHLPNCYLHSIDLLDQCCACSTGLVYRVRDFFFFKHLNFIKLRLLKGKKKPYSIKKEKVFLLLLRVRPLLYFSRFFLCFTFGASEHREDKGMTTVLGQFQGYFMSFKKQQISHKLQNRRMDHFCIIKSLIYCISPNVTVVQSNNFPNCLIRHSFIQDLWYTNHSPAY